MFELVLPRVLNSVKVHHRNVLHLQRFVAGAKYVRFHEALRASAEKPEFSLPPQLLILPGYALAGLLMNLGSLHMYLRMR